MIGQDWRLCSDHSQDPLTENYDQSVKTELHIECVKDDVSPSKKRKLVTNTSLQSMAESVQDNDQHNVISVGQQEHKKPPLTYSQLIVEALRGADDSKLQLREIYSHINKKYPFYKMSDEKWKNGVRHNLTLNEGFENVSESSKVGQGSYWRIRDGFEVRELFLKKATPVKTELEINEDDFDFEPKYNNAQVKKTKMEYCDICGKSLKDLVNPTHHLWGCRNKSKPEMCPKCGEMKVNMRMSNHLKTCDPIKKLCKHDHEHTFINKTFDTFEDAIAYFYDAELDAVFAQKSGHRESKVMKDRYMQFLCGRSKTYREYKSEAPKDRQRIRKKLDKECTAQIKITYKGKVNKAFMYGCTTHNHQDNPTMKKVSWLTKRKIAKYFLLGHSRLDIKNNIMPQLHVEGQK